MRWRASVEAGLGRLKAVRRIAIRRWMIFLAAVAGCVDAEANRTGAGDVLSWGGPGRGPGQFVKPRAIAAHGDRLYIVDMSGRIQVFDLEGTHLATWTLPETSRGFPTGLAVRPDGCLAVADTHNYVVRFFGPDGAERGTIGREGGGHGEFTYLTDVAFDLEGNMYVTEHGRVDRVQKFDETGRFLLTWGQTGMGPGQFRRPQSVVVGEDGTVYVADAANHRIQCFTPDGRFKASFGGPGRGNGQFLYPYGLAMVPGRYLLVCEFGNHRVQAFDLGGRPRGAWGSAGSGPGQLAAPWGVAWVAGRGLYVADTNNHRVQVFRAAELEDEDSGQWAMARPESRGNRAIIDH